MHLGSTLTREDAAAAVEMFEEGYSAKSVARSTGLARNSIQMLHSRWQVRGRSALDTRERRLYSFETKLEIVRRHLGGESGRLLAEVYGLPSPGTVGNWATIYRRDGEDGLRKKKSGRRPSKSSPPLSETDTLRLENERLRAEVAYLGKLRALRSLERP